VANIDLPTRVVRIVEFASTLGYEVTASAGKSRDAVRTIEVDDGLIGALCLQRKQQAAERLDIGAYEESHVVFTRPDFVRR
jgi:hypothetical protein